MSYQNTCCECGNVFVHASKRAVVCHTCAFPKEAAEIGELKAKLEDQTTRAETAEAELSLAHNALHNSGTGGGARLHHGIDALSRRTHDAEATLAGALPVCRTCGMTFTAEASCWYCERDQIGIHEEQVKDLKAKLKKALACPYCGSGNESPETVGEHMSVCDESPIGAMQAKLAEAEKRLDEMTKMQQSCEEFANVEIEQLTERAEKAEAERDEAQAACVVSNNLPTTCTACGISLLVTQAEYDEARVLPWPHCDLKLGQGKKAICEKCRDEIATELMEAQHERDLTEKHAGRVEAACAKYREALEKMSGWGTEATLRLSEFGVDPSVIELGMSGSSEAKKALATNPGGEKILAVARAAEAWIKPRGSHTEADARARALIDAVRDWKGE